MQMLLRSVSPCVHGLVVSIHDVSPHTWEAVQEIRDDLVGWGVTRVSHLVVPNHHYRGCISDYPDFCDWLRKESASGNEIVAHGFYHERPRVTSERLLDRWITSTYTAGEGEYYDLSAEESEIRTREGNQIFRNMGLAPTGFIAPAWLLGEEAGEGVRRVGYDYTTRLGSVEDWKAGVAYHSQSLVYSVRAGWRRGMSLAWNESLSFALESNPLVRLGLHPPDWRFPAIRAHALRCVTRALAARVPMTYDQWLCGQRAVSIGS